MSWWRDDILRPGLGPVGRFLASLRPRAWYAIWMAMAFVGFMWAVVPWGNLAVTVWSFVRGDLFFTVLVMGVANILVLESLRFGILLGRIRYGLQKMPDSGSPYRNPAKTHFQEMPMPLFGTLPPHDRDPCRDPYRHENAAKPLPHLQIHDWGYASLVHEHESKNPQKDRRPLGI